MLLRSCSGLSRTTLFHFISGRMETASSITAGALFFKAFHLLFVQDGPEGQTREGDSSCSDGLLPSGENL